MTKQNNKKIPHYIQVFSIQSERYEIMEAAGKEISIKMLPQRFVQKGYTKYISSNILVYKISFHEKSHKI